MHVFLGVASLLPGLVVLRHTEQEYYTCTSYDLFHPSTPLFVYILIPIRAPVTFYGLIMLA